MKRLILFVTFISIAHIGKTQTLKNSLAEMHLNGKVKEVVVNYFDNIDKIDTLKLHPRDILLFDTTGNEIKEIHHDTDKVVTSVFTYNQKAENTEITYYDSSGTQIYKTILNYNEKGYLIEKEIISPNIVLKSRYKYDNMGKQEEQDSFDNEEKPNDTTSKVFFKYDKNGNLMEKSIYLSNNRLAGKRIYNYDSQGLEIYAARYTVANRLTDETKSEYTNIDSQGNWLTETEENKAYGRTGGINITKNVTKREIIYFK